MKGNFDDLLQNLGKFPALLERKKAAVTKIFEGQIKIHKLDCELRILNVQELMSRAVKCESLNDHDKLAVLKQCVELVDRLQTLKHS